MILDQLVCACSEDVAGDAVWAAALRGLTLLNVLLTLATVKEYPQVLVTGRVSGTVLSSKRAKTLLKGIFLHYFASYLSVLVVIGMLSVNHKIECSQCISLPCQTHGTPPQCVGDSGCGKRLPT
jgi:hypothetical protein